MNDRLIKIPEELLKEAECWLDGALHCKEWHWSPDQWDAASFCLVELRKLLGDKTPSTKINARQADVLLCLDEDVRMDHYRPLEYIAADLGWLKNEVRIVVRALARKGLAKRVPWHDDEGYIRGSGYAITPAGQELAAKLRSADQQKEEQSS